MEPAAKHGSDAPTASPTSATGSGPATPPPEIQGIIDRLAAFIKVGSRVGGCTGLLATPWQKTKIRSLLTPHTPPGCHCCTTARDPAQSARLPWLALPTALAAQMAVCCRPPKAAGW